MMGKSSKWVSNVEPILKYGIRGLVLGLAYLTFDLIKELGVGDKLTTTSVLGILIVLLLCIIGAGFGEYLDYKKHIVPKIGKVIGAGPEESFIKGGDARKLAGRWKVFWYVQNPSEQPSSYPATTPDKEPEPEKHYLIIDGSQIHSIGDDPTTHSPYYWSFGRSSTKDYVTLMYWSDHQSNTRILVGTVFLKIIEEVNQPIQMEGWWTGFTREKKVAHGQCVWKKEQS